MKVMSRSRITGWVLGVLMTCQMVGQVETEQRWQGLLWEIDGNGLTTPSYLYGTMHVSSKLAFHLSDSVYLGIRNCDIVALETDPSTWMDDFLDEDSYDYYDYYSYYSSGFYTEAFKIDFPTNDELAYELRREHSMTNHMLYRASYYGNSEFEEQTYLDLFIYQAGRKWKKGIAALEDYEVTMDLLDKAYEPDEDADEEEYYDYWDIYGYGKSPYEMIEDAYRSGDLDLLDSLGRLTNPSRNYHKYFIEERNKIMAENMDSIMQAGSSLFTAVGAAHLPGDTGVIELLRYMGYDVRPVEKTQTKVGKKLKDKLESIYLEPTYSKQTSSDGVFSVNMPGFLYQTSNEVHTKEYFYPDMSNGSYYSVNRVNHFGMFAGQSEQYILDRIDSMLYENIPGKIISQKDIVRNGIPGIEINNVTRQGEHQRYHIYVTPLEIFVFKMSGNDEYVKDYGDPFFNSISFAQNSQDWMTFERGGGVFSVSLPGSSVIRSFDESVSSSSNKEFAHGLNADGDYYFFALSTLHDHYYIEDDTFELTRLTKRFAEQLEYDVVDSELATYDGHPTITAHLSGNDKHVYLRFVLVGPLYYLLGVQAAEPDHEFLRSLKLKKASFSEPFETYTDSSYFFTVETLPEEWEEDSYDPYSYYYYYEEEDRDYDSGYGQKVFRSDSTYEEIQVYYTKYHNYYSVDMERGFWSDYLDREYWTEDGGIVVSTEMDTTAVVPWLYIVLGDSGSADRIHMKYVLQEGAMYTISYATDSVTGTSEYAATFFDSFRPMADTLIGCNIFESKADMFFDYAASNDSVSVMQALNSISVVDFGEEHIERLKELLDTLDYERYGMHYRPTIIEEIGWIESERLLDYFEDMYMAVGDTATLQIEILRAFGHQNTKEGMERFRDMIIYDTPLSNDSWDISNIFYSISDSLELAATLFPEMLDFTYFDEYRNEVLNLLTMLLDSGIVEPKLYEDKVQTLTMEAGYELKRLKASEEDEFSSYDYYGYDYGYSYDDGYSYSDSWRKKSDLENYVIILAPFHDDPAVAKFMNKLLYVEDANLKLTTAKMMVTYEIEGSDTIWANFIQEDKYRKDVIMLLDQLERLDLVDSTEYAQEAIARSLAMSGYYYGEDPDTVLFVRREYVKSAKSEGWVYFFKYENGPKWELAYAGFLPEDASDLDLEEVEGVRGTSFRNEEEMEEEILHVLDYFYVKDRQRAVGGSVGDDYYGYYGWYY